MQAVEPVTASRNSRTARVERAERLLAEPIHFVPSAEFTGEDVKQVLASAAALGEQTDRVGRMCEEPLLPPDEEQALFREMNHLRQLACQKAESINRSNPRSADLDLVERMLSESARLRDHLIRSNMRLVYAVVKKSIGPSSPLSFDELVSDGVCTLMNAVDKFDYSRGFRFSTYAYRSIARTVYRAISAAQKEEARLARNADEWAFEQQPEDSPTLAHDEVGIRLRSAAADMIQELDRREQLIIRSRYALGAHRKSRSFQDIANRLGISKERVRQLEQRASEKLRAMAAQLDQDELFGAALA